MAHRPARIVRVLLESALILASHNVIARGSSERELPATELYNRVGPSLAFVETPIATGSGVLTEGSYIVTNAHVVWPYETVRVTFPDGTELLDVPVASQDLIGDLALLGPVPVKYRPLSFATNENLPVGSDVYLIGYPLETEAFPTPTIARGIISRIREWPLVGLTYFQTDASIAGGQSGGVLASSRGEILGISGLASEGSNFGLAASISDLEPRIEALKRGDDVGGTGRRGLPSGPGSATYEVALESIWATAAFVSFGAPGAYVEVRAKADRDIALYLLDAYGDEVSYSDDHEDSSEESLEGYPWSAIRYVQAEPVTDWELTLRIEASEPLIPIEDPDDGEVLETGARYSGHLDYPFDYDRFTIMLERGDRITVSVESVMIDPYLFIDLRGEEFAIEDEDSGGGLLGLNSRITFEATSTGDHLIVVTDSSGYLTGGYLLRVETASAGEPALRFEKTK